MQLWTVFQKLINQRIVAKKNKKQIYNLSFSEKNQETFYISTILRISLKNYTSCDSKKLSEIYGVLFKVVPIYITIFLFLYFFYFNLFIKFLVSDNFVANNAGFIFHFCRLIENKNFVFLNNKLLNMNVVENFDLKNVHSKFFQVHYKFNKNIYFYLKHVIVRTFYFTYQLL